MSNGGNINSFVATLDELLRFLNSYQEDLFYFDINATEPPAGARQFDITTFSAQDAQRIIEEIHPGVNPPRMTPGARQKISSAPPPIDPVETRIECGMNLDPRNPVGMPFNINELANVDWVRFPFLASPAHFPNLDAAFNFYDAVINAYDQLGAQILLVLTHQTYGEGAGFNWAQMNSQKWTELTNGFVPIVEQIVRRYGNTISAYEVWNEGDVEVGNPSAVGIPAADYAPLLDRVETVIRQHASNASVIVGGLVRGPAIGAQYVKQIRSTLGGRLPADAIGYHPYGKGAPNDGSIFSRLGSIKRDIEIFDEAAPNVPLWLTEVGALGTDDPNFWDDAAAYMKNLYSYLRTSQAKRTPVVIWYAWSDAMDVAQKTNGVVDKQGKPKPHLYNAFFNEACK
jgi:hypothetical protein